MTMRTMRKTSVNFGLVNVLVKVYKATESSDVSFSTFHKSDDCKGSVGFIKCCKACDKKLETDEIFKGVKVDEHVVPITEEDLASIEIETGSGISVDKFIDASQIDQISVESHYYLEPEKASLEGYNLLRQAMIDMGRVAVVKFSMRRSGSAGKSQLGIVRPYGDKVLVLEGISYPEEIRVPAFAILDTPAKVNPAAVEMAKQLVESMSGDFDPHDYTDEYADRLNQIIEAKSTGADVIPINRNQDDGGEVSDLMAKLAASVEKKKASTPAVTANKKPYAAPTKKAPAKKAPAKKVSA